VQALGECRGTTAAARELYEETQESIIARERTAEQRRLASAGIDWNVGRPSKKDRRDIERLRRSSS
jgi:ribosome-associated heat shock protein Hsp15